MHLHRIEQRNEKPFVQEVPKKHQLQDGKNAKLIEEVDQAEIGFNNEDQLKKLTPRYFMTTTSDGMKVVLARIPIWQSVIDNVSLSVIAGDCLSVKTADGQDIVNINLSQSIDPEKSRAIFNKSSKILTIILPIV